MKTKTYIIIALLTLLSGCTKDDSQKLPPATQVGANTFGCKIEGVPYSVKGKWEYRMITLTSGVKAEYISDEGKMWIYSEFNHPSSKEVYLIFKYDGLLGKYTDIMEVKKNTNSYVKITRFDSEVISGIFNVILRRPIYFGGDTITTRYTEGRFDIKLKN